MVAEVKEAASLVEKAIRVLAEYQIDCDFKEREQRERVLHHTLKIVKNERVVLLNVWRRLIGR